MLYRGRFKICLAINKEKRLPTFYGMLRCDRLSYLPLLAFCIGTRKPISNPNRITRDRILNDLSVFAHFHF